jgi:hypothetical protein
MGSSGHALWNCKGQSKELWRFSVSLVSCVMNTIVSKCYHGCSPRNSSSLQENNLQHQSTRTSPTENKLGSFRNRPTQRHKIQQSVCLSESVRLPGYPITKQTSKNPRDISSVSPKAKPTRFSTLQHTTTRDNARYARQCSSAVLASKSTLSCPFNTNAAIRQCPEYAMQRPTFPMENTKTKRFLSFSLS